LPTWMDSKAKIARKPRVVWSKVTIVFGVSNRPEFRGIGRGGFRGARPIVPRPGRARSAWFFTRRVWLRPEPRPVEFVPTPAEYFLHHAPGAPLAGARIPPESASDFPLPSLLHDSPLSPRPQVLTLVFPFSSPRVSPRLRASASKKTVLVGPGYCGSGSDCGANSNVLCSRRALSDHL
jgi:hypothetical protein